MAFVADEAGDVVQIEARNSSGIGSGALICVRVGEEADARPNGSPCQWSLVKIDFGDETHGGVLAVGTDARGRFELPVPTGQYVDLIAFDQETLKCARARHVLADSGDVVLRLEPGKQ